MRTSSMSSGTTLLASRNPQQAQTQAIGSGSTPSQNLIGQLPTNPALLKAATGQQNVAKMFNTNTMPTVGSILNSSNNHRNTPPSTMPPSFPFHSQRANNPQQRMPFSTDSSSFSNDFDFPSLNTRSSSASSNNLFSGSQLKLLQQQSMNAFPSATKDALNSIQQQHRMPYANLMRSVDSNGRLRQEFSSSEFSLQNEDFPALPGVTQQQQLQNQLGSSGASGQTNSESQLLTSGQTNFGAQSNFYNVVASSVTDFFMKGTSENGKDSKHISINTTTGVVSNIPSTMLCDQYGIVGLLTFMKGLDQFPGLSMLSIGVDITKLGLNMGASGNLHQSFGGPWSEQPFRIQDYEEKVPDEYLTNNVIREKLPTIKVNKLSEDILFFLFYNCPGQVYQLAAASELYQRDWRYHKIDAVWLTRSTFGGVKDQTQEYETGSYNIFDPLQWRKVPKEMKLEYKNLEGPVRNLNSI